MLDFIRPVPTLNFGINDLVDLKLITRLRLKLSHLRAHIFKHNSQDTLNPLCSCGLEIEDNEHFFLRCRFFASDRCALFEKLLKLNISINNLPTTCAVDILLYDDRTLDPAESKLILEAAITFIKITGRFSGSL